ncbi:hypothetical protein GGQ08_003160 [Salinibacter ruber]|uniref:hypothetical protein n=1 Tax=Salinibacter ruber TaxID=146919 RepID=UPI002166ED69|nr:hypothetical protein [Salinibacter ruber]MCS3651942.1 hypothetical protein [Salinibacter ruber]MCS3655069.1 hypothetical protein [Salinibacter ruber]
MKTALQVGFWSLLAALGAAVVWGAWEARTTALQVLVIGCVATYVAAGWAASREEGVLQGALPHGETYRTVAMFIAGAGIGALAYHGTVDLLLAAMLAGIVLWVVAGGLLSISSEVASEK